MAYQSLYRRYRSRNFAEIIGQEHVTTALRNAVADGRYGHAYLFSGPRGTGKTSTARVLAKALNCENLVEGEPDGTCKSCLDIENGRSFDLHELDAASNNKVDDVRDLIAKVALGSPGRTKVYILDEVHMLSAGAENALLKTLEEPPDHVVFVLATTEPHKVVETIRSRTQHFEFHLLPGAVLEAHLRHVIADAELDVDQEGIDYALRQGGGSARDTLSALDLVAAAGGVPKGTDIGRELSLAIGAGDPAAAIAAVQRAITTGREPRTIGEATLASLRNAFLTAMGAPLGQLSEAAEQEAAEVAEALGAATITRSLEMLGAALVEMRQAPDPRVPLEVALLRLTRREGNDSAALLQRIESLEAQVAALGSGSAAPAPRPAPSTDPQAESPAARPDPPAASAPPVAPTQAPPASEPAPPPSPRARAERRPPPPSEPPASPAPAPATDAAPPTETAAPTDRTPAADDAPAPAANPASAGSVSLGSLQAAFDGTLLDGVSQKVRIRFRTGRFVALDGDTAVFGVPNSHYVSRANEVKAEVEAAIAASFGQPVTIDVRVDDAPPPPTRGGVPMATPSRSEAAPPAASPPEPDEPIDVTDLADATDVAASGVERLTRAFPGAEVVPPSDS